LVPAMRLEAQVHLAKDAPADQGVSYGHTYTTSEDTTLAVIPMGYADGIPWHVSNSAPVLLGGRRHRIAGRVCMDQFVLDVGRHSGVRAGDTAVLFGSGTEGEATAQDWAEAAGTISYEIVTRLGTRVPRVDVGEQQGPRPGRSPCPTPRRPATSDAASPGCCAPATCWCSPVNAAPGKPP